jgi:hypothetical protein
MFPKIIKGNYIYSKFTVYFTISKKSTNRISTDKIIKQNSTLSGLLIKLVEEMI